MIVRMLYICQRQFKIICEHDCIHARRPIYANDIIKPSAMRQSHSVTSRTQNKAGAMVVHSLHDSALDMISTKIQIESG